MVSYVALGLSLYLYGYDKKYLLADKQSGLQTAIFSE